MRVVLSARAEAELAQIFSDSIERLGEETAKKYARQLDRRLSLFARDITHGRARPDLGAEVRSIAAGAHIIFFKIVANDALVLSVRHARRQAPSAGELT